MSLQNYWKFTIKVFVVGMFVVLDMFLVLYFFVIMFGNKNVLVENAFFGNCHIFGSLVDVATYQETVRNILP